MNETLQLLGEAIRHVRESLGYSQEDLADKSGLHRTYIGGVERGERNVGYINLQKISKALDIDISSLLRGL